MEEPIMKSLSLSSVFANQAIEDGVITWPLPPGALLDLYNNCSEHQACCQAIPEGAFGGGVSGSGAAALEKLLPDGVGPVSFCVEIGKDLKYSGNAFAELTNLGGKIIGLKRLPPTTMYRKLDGSFLQWYIDVDGKEIKIQFEADEIIHFRVPCPAGLYYALPDWLGAHGIIELVKAAIDYNGSFFRNNCIPAFHVHAKGGKLKETSKQSIKDFFISNFQGLANAFRGIFTQSDSEKSELIFNKLTADHKDGDFIKLLDAGRERILTAHRVPPQLLSVMTAGRLGGSGEIEMQMKVFERLRCAPFRRRFVEQLQLYVPGEYKFEPFSIPIEDEKRTGIDELVKGLW